MNCMSTPQATMNSNNNSSNSNSQTGNNNDEGSATPEAPVLSVSELLVQFLLQYEATAVNDTTGRHFHCAPFDTMFVLMARHKLCSDTILLTAMVYLSRILTAVHVNADALDNLSSNNHTNSSYSTQSIFAVVPKKEAYPAIIITQQNVRLVFLACLAIACKVTEDIPYDNYTFASLGKVDKQLLNACELAVLKCLRFHLACESQELQDLHARLARLFSSSC